MVVLYLGRASYGNGLYKRRSGISGTTGTYSEGGKLNPVVAVSTKTRFFDGG